MKHTFLPLPTRIHAPSEKQKPEIVTLQGARACNEDRAHSPHACVYCVHDGHAGEEAVERLVEILSKDIDWPSATGAEPTPALVMQFLIDVYTHAARWTRRTRASCPSRRCARHLVCFLAGWATVRAARLR
jgi:hypothetical protein